MTPRTFTALFPFGGLGAGALGFVRASARLFGADARFRVLGGIDIDPAACADFARLTGAPSLCVPVEDLTPERLRAFAGESAPDVVFLSPPCKGASGLLSAAKSKSAKYAAMNELALVWLRLMLATWATPPKLVLLENVPRLKSRAAAMVREYLRLLRAAGYVTSDGFHDCGEIGGLAQHRRRLLIVARHAQRVPPILYQPPRKRVRGCGEVLGELPLPEDPASGPMHRLPRLSWLNWVRLALIPAGGDWRDLPGVLAEGEARRERFKRHAVESWDEPVGTVGGSGTNGVANVADPRLAMKLGPNAHHNINRVEAWDVPAHTVIGATRVGSGALSVADPRVRRAFDHGYAVLPWTAPSFTVAGGSHPGQGAYSVADPRAEGRPPWRRMSLDEALSLEVADPRKPPPFVPVIVARDGTWHRPLTTLELAALQGLPTRLDGQPVVLAGSSSSAWRERIGNAVPTPAAEAIATAMLTTLLQGELESWAMSSGGAVWVRPAAARAEARRP